MRTATKSGFARDASSGSVAVKWSLIIAERSLVIAPLRMIAAAAHRVWNAPTAWYWIYNLLRLGAGVVLLPLMTTKLTEEDMGMQTLFTSLYYLVAVMEL